jgi:hypothetical protein
MDYNQNDNFLLSAKPESLSFLKFQVIYQIKEKKKFIRSVNFLHGDKIIKKIYLKNMLPCNQDINIEPVIINLLFKDLIENDSKVSKSKNMKPDADARIKAATNLLTDLGL